MQALPPAKHYTTAKAPTAVLDGLHHNGHSSQLLQPEIHKRFLALADDLPPRKEQHSGKQIFAYVTATTARHSPLQANEPEIPGEATY